MPKSPACTGAPAYGAPMQVSFTYPTMRETSSLTTELPSSEPASAQITYTIGANDLPVATPKIPFQLAPLLWAQGDNTSGTSRTVSFRLEKNGTSTATGSASIGNGQTWFLNGHNWGTAMPVAGDVLTVKLWASGAGTYLNAHAMACGVTRPLCGQNRVVLWAAYDATNCIAVESTVAKPTWMTGTMTGNAAWGYSFHNSLNNTTNDRTLITSTATAPYALMVRAAEGLFRARFPDFAQYNVVAASANAAAAAGFTIFRVTLLTYLPLNIPL